MVIWRQTYGTVPLQLAARDLLYAPSHRQDSTPQPLLQSDNWCVIFMFRVPQTRFDLTAVGRIEIY